MFSKTNRVLFLIIAAFFFVIFFFKPLLNFIEDDAYFYSQVAYNIAENGKSTFDGVNITSGYHLLWCGILSLISKLAFFVTNDKIFHLFFYLLFYFLFFSVFLSFFSKNIFEVFFYLVLVLLSYLLMETFLLGLFLVIILWILFNNKEDKISYLTILCLVVFFIPITRIDSSVILIIFFIYFILHKKYKILILMILSLFFGILVHFVLMKIFFNNFFSVSSMLKTGSLTIFSIKLFINNIISDMGYFFRFFIFLILIFINIILIIPNLKDKKNQLLLFMIISVSVFTLAHLYFNKIRFWYYTPAYIISVYVMFNLNFKSEQNKLIFLKKIFIIFLCVLLFFLLSFYVYKNIKFWNVIKSANEFTNKIKKYVPENEAIYQINGSGFIGYFSERNVVNGDGLINNYEYVKLLNTNNLDGYLEKNKINYIVFNTIIDEKSEFLINYHGLKIKKDNAKLLLRSSNYGKKRFKNYSLYKIVKND